MAECGIPARGVRPRIPLRFMRATIERASSPRVLVRPRARRSFRSLCLPFAREGRAERLGEEGRARGARMKGHASLSFGLPYAGNAFRHTGPACGQRQSRHAGGSGKSFTHRSGGPGPWKQSFACVPHADGEPPASRSTQRQRSRRTPYRSGTGILIFLSEGKINRACVRFRQQ